VIQQSAKAKWEQPVQFGFNSNVAGGCSRPVSFVRPHHALTVKKRRNILGAGLAIIIVMFAVCAFGMVRPFQIIGGSMKPELTPGDCFVSKRLTFLARSPRRGDIVILRAEGLPPLQEGVVYPKRIVGLPGDLLRLADGKLYVNDKHVAFRNRYGEITYVILPGSKYLTSNSDTLTLPEGHYFFLGDNSPDSLDSRACGFLSANSIWGRPWFCYWPPEHMGLVR
jgi:signal peptidase I